LLINGVLTPLNLLYKLMNEVKNGNLDCPVLYPNKDEFGKVFIEFDEMRLRLKMSLEKLAEQEAVRKEMVVSIAHDIKTPVTAISGHAEGLLDGIANTPEKQKKYLETILQKAKAVDGMVNDLFFFSKLDLKQILFTLQKVNAADYFISVYDELLVGQDDVLFKTDIQIDSGKKIVVDPLQFKRVLQNTFTNSLKYRSEEKLTIHLSLYENNNRVIAKIADNGIGVSDEECEKLFLRFFRSDRARSSQGSGLGLSISKQIVEAMDGLIWARRNETKGISIYISLPEAGDSL
jgi:signal transduction histidine kinase